MSLFRLNTILKTLIVFGLDKLIPAHRKPWQLKLLRIVFFWYRDQHKDKKAGERIRLALESLGPVFIKLGQMLSTRRDLLPHDIADELAKLQDKVTPFDGNQAQSIIEESLNIDSINEYFDDFDTTPLASASIAQVHTARLKDEGQAIVLKVIRPNITETIHADLQLMFTIARVLSKVLKDAQRLRPVEVVHEYQKTLLDELDLTREAANCEQLRKNFTDSPLLYVPKIYGDYCRTNVLVMERINGVPVSDIETLNEHGTDLEILAERGVEVFFTQVFRDSFFHADMHPGNIFVDNTDPSDPHYIAIDFGIVGTLNSQDKRYLAENFIAFFNRDYRKVAELHVDSGWVPHDTNVDEFEVDIRSVCEPIFEKPLAEISFGLVLLQLFNTARRYNMIVQPQLVLLQKTLLYIEGLGRQLYPQLDLWKTAKPFLENWINEQMGYKAVFKKVKNNFPFWAEKLPEMPELLFDSLTTMKRLPATQEDLIHDLKHQQKRLAGGIVYGLSATTLTLISVMTWGLSVHPYLNLAGVIVSLVMWWQALKAVR